MPTSSPEILADSLPPLPLKRYYALDEVAALCGVKPHVLHYWEQEFTQLRPARRKGSRRYYQHHEVLLVRRIRQLLQQEGATLGSVRHQLGVAHVHELETGQELEQSRALIAELRTEFEETLAVLRA
jgi:DNA-binding transcriptional MerR regulator